MAGNPVNPMDRPDLDFSPEEIKEITADLNALASTPEWRTFGQVLKEATSAARAQGFADREKIDYWAGYVDGIIYVWQIRSMMEEETRRILAREEAEGDAARISRERQAQRQAVFDDGDLSL